MSYPEDGWSHADLVSTRDIIECTIIENRGSALYLQPNHDMWGGGGVILDVYKVTDTDVTDNTQGVEQYLGNSNYGYYSEIYLTGVIFEDNDDYSINIDGDSAWDGFNRWGLSRVRGAMVYVEDCRFNTRAAFIMEGADDTGGSDWVSVMGVQFTDKGFGTWCRRRGSFSTQFSWT